MKKIITLILAFVMLFSCVSMLFSCTEKDDVDDGSNTSDNGEDTKIDNVSGDTYEDVLEARKQYMDEVPELDFGGAEFRMVVQTALMNDAWAETGTGDQIDEAVYERNLYVQERLGVTIVEPYNTDWLSIDSYIVRMCESGTDEADLYLAHALQGGIAALNGNFINWLDPEMKYVDFNKPWYPQDIVENLSMNGLLYLLPSDMCISLTSHTYCMYYNKEIAEDLKIGDMYELVENGEWTIDKLMELSKDYYIDDNNNNTRDKEDIYGFTSDIWSAINTYLWAFDYNIVSVDSEGNITGDFNNERVESIMSKISSLIYDNEGTFPVRVNFDPEVDDNTAKTMFNASKTLFVNAYIGDSLQFFSDMEEFGIIPYPKWDTNQENYKTMVGGDFSILAIPKTAPDLKMIGAVVEVMSAYSWREVIPVYYDLILKVRGTRDVESIEMLDRIMESRVVDFQYVYDNFEGFAFDPQRIIQQEAEFSSYCASIEKSREFYYKRLTKFFNS